MVTPQDIQILAAMALVAIGLAIGYVCGLSDGRNQKVKTLLDNKAEYNRWLDRIIKTCWGNQWAGAAMMFEEMRGHIVASLCLEDFLRDHYERNKK